MSLIAAKEHLAALGLADRVREFPVSSATVALAAEALSCAPERIAKSISLLQNGRAILVVTAGDRKIDNAKYKARFGVKASMLPADQVESSIGHAVGGVCPFGIKEGVLVYLDDSLKRFEAVFPACGSSNSAVELTISELEKASGSAGWVDVCKPKD